MADILQNSDDLPILIRIFLAAFVVLGLLPPLKKRLSKILDYLSHLGQPDMPGIEGANAAQEHFSATSSPMTDIEYFVFTRLAQGGKKGMTPAAVAKSLHMDRQMIRKALLSLRRKGFLHFAPDWKMVQRVMLSKQGQALAMAEGLIPKLTHRPL
jgi:hypothetical protein